MASSEPQYTERTSFLGTKPRTREEVREEIREEIRLLDLARPTAEEKLRLEREAVLGSIGEVELFEKSWRKTSPETIGEIQRKVDALELGGTRGPAAMRSMPAPREAPKPEAAEAWEPAPGPRPARTPKTASSRLTPADQKAIAKHLGVTLQRVTVLFATSRGRVVEATHKAGDATLTTMVLLGENGQVSTMDEIGARLDAMALPLAAPRATEPDADAPDEPLAAAPPHARAEGRTDLIEAIEGIGEVFGRKLAASGVTTLEEFMAADPATLAAETGIREDTVRKWRAMGALQAINGVGPQYSELLVRAGVTTMAQLAAHDADDLARKLTKYEASLGKRVTGATITPALVQHWIEGAQQLAPPPSARATQDEAEDAEDEPAPAKAKANSKFGLKRGKAPPADAAPKAKRSLSFGRKGTAAPAEQPGEPSAHDAPDAGESSEDAPAKKKFGFKLRKR